MRTSAIHVPIFHPTNAAAAAMTPTCRLFSPPLKPYVAVIALACSADSLVTPPDITAILCVDICRESVNRKNSFSPTPICFDSAADAVASMGIVLVAIAVIAAAVGAIDLAAPSNSPVSPPAKPGMNADIFPNASKSPPPPISNGKSFSIAVPTKPNDSVIPPMLDTKFSAPSIIFINVGSSFENSLTASSSMDAFSNVNCPDSVPIWVSYILATSEFCVTLSDRSRIASLPTFSNAAMPGPAFAPIS